MQSVHLMLCFGRRKESGTCTVIWFCTRTVTARHRLDQKLGCVNTSRVWIRACLRVCRASIPIAVSCLASVLRCCVLIVFLFFIIDVQRCSLPTALTMSGLTTGLQCRRMRQSYGEHLIDLFISIPLIFSSETKHD